MHTPPEHLAGPRVELARATPDHALALAAAVRASLDHLGPWMPWADEAAATEAAQRERLAGRSWETDSDYHYVMVLPGTDAVVGACSLMRRPGPGALEIGYWVHVDHTRQGIATAAAGLLCDAGRSLDGIGELQIHCDEQNRASAAVPPKLGFILDRVVEVSLDAPSASGRTMIWVLR